MDIMGLLGKLDYTAIIASVVTFIAGLAIVKVQLKKSLAVIGEVADLLSVIKGSLADDKLDAEEVKMIVTEAQELIAEFKK
jgi:uncharacterized protein YgfB (UPF0149 family)